jgi:outer membrane protein
MKNFSSKPLLAFFALLVTVPASAQTAGGTMRLGAEEAVRLAVENNPGYAADRLDPAIGDTRVAQAAGAFTPALSSTLQRNNQLSPPSSFLIGAEGTLTDTYTSNVSLGQRLPWGGGSYEVGWDASRVSSNSFLQNFNPTLRSGLTLSVSQPLLRDFNIDGARQQLMTTRIDRDIDDTRLRESSVHLAADVRRAYWDLVAARALITVQQQGVDLARELARVNKARVEVGQNPQIDLLSAQAEVAQREEALIVAQATSRQVEDRLRTLIFPPDRSDLWTVTIEPTDVPALGGAAPDLDSAIARALDTRSDLQRSRLEIRNAQSAVRFADNQRLPDVRLLADYQANGLGGTRLNRVGGFPGTIVGGGPETSLGQVLDQVLKAEFPTWTVGLTVTYPLGKSYDEASLARARLEETQATKRLQDAQTIAVREIRQVALQLEMNAKRIEVTRLARELAEQRLDAEQKRYDVGMSTSFLVIQAQRDLADARNNELAARLSYSRSLIDFDAIVQAPPAGGPNSTGGSPGPVIALPMTTRPLNRVSTQAGPGAPFQ